MRRAREEDDDREATLAALVHANFAFTLAQIPELVYAFRYHPWRLLRLMSTSKTLRAQIEAALRTYPRLWYSCALTAFPDFVILLCVYKHLSTLGDYLTSWVQILSTLQVDHPSQYTVEHRLLHLHYRSYKSFSCCDGLVDRSFHAPAILDACLVDEERARAVAQCFRMLFPFGVPPAQYCFASQIALHQFTVTYLAVNDQSLGHILRNFTLMPDHVTPDFTPRWMGYVTLQTCERWRTQGSGEGAAADGAGPRFPQWELGGLGGNIDKPGYAGAVFELTDLLALMRGRPQRFQPTCLFYKRVAEACHLYWRGVDPPPTIIAMDGETPLVVDVTERRAARLARYGTVDPLYINTLIAGDDDAFPLVPDWKQALVELIDLVKKELPGTEEYRRMEARLTSARCGHCGQTARKAETSAPFGAYCNDDCQEAAYTRQ